MRADTPAAAQAARGKGSPRASGRARRQPQPSPGQQPPGPAGARQLLNPTGTLFPFLEVLFAAVFRNTSLQFTLQNLLNYKFTAFRIPVTLLAQLT